MNFTDRGFLVILIFVAEYRPPAVWESPESYPLLIVMVLGPAILWEYMANPEKEFIVEKAVKRLRS